MGRVPNTYDSVKEIIRISKEENISTNRSAEKMAEDRIERMKRVSTIYLDK